MTVTIIRQTDELYTMRNGEQRPVLLVDKDGQEKRAVRLDNGTLQECGTGYFLDGGAETQITPANAREMNARRYELARQAAAEGLTASKLGARHEYDAWREIVKAQSELAQDKEQGKASTLAAQFVGKAAGFEREKGEDQASPGLTVNISRDGVEALAAMLRRDRDAVDAEFKDL